MRKRTNRMQVWHRTDKLARLFAAREIKHRARLAREQEAREYRRRCGEVVVEWKSAAEQKHYAMKSSWDKKHYALR